MVTRLKPKFTEAKAMPRLPKARIRSLALTDALMVVEWLNADVTQGTAERLEVLRLRDEFEALGAMLQSLHQQCTHARKGRQFPPTREEIEQILRYSKEYNLFRERHNKFTKALTAYPFCPSMTPDILSGNWYYNTVPTDAPGPEITITLEGISSSVNAAAVVMALARLAGNKELHKLRLCEECKKNWRVSERDIDRFCSSRCRELWHKAQPDFKERRKKIQKNYRDRLFPK